MHEVNEKLLRGVAQELLELGVNAQVSGMRPDIESVDDLGIRLIELGRLVLFEANRSHSYINAKYAEHEKRLDGDRADELVAEAELGEANAMMWAEQKAVERAEQEAAERAEQEAAERVAKYAAEHIAA